MTARTDSSSFTLVETMIASSIALVIMIALASMFLFCQRMFRLTMAEAESTLAMREIRDKLLFRAGPGLSSGLLTGKAYADAASITMNWPTLDTDAANDRPDRIRLIWRDSAFFNERLAHTDANFKWFKPNGFAMRQDWSHAVDLPRLKIDLGSSVEGAVQQTTWILLPQ